MQEIPVQGSYTAHFCTFSFRQASCLLTQTPVNINNHTGLEARKLRFKNIPSTYKLMTLNKSSYLFEHPFYCYKRDNTAPLKDSYADLMRTQIFKSSIDCSNMDI